jgi:hypothetical protein
MSVRRPAIAGVVIAMIALVAVACVSSRLVASIVGVATIAAVVLDILLHDEPPPPPRRSRKLQVDLVNRATRR